MEVVKISKSEKTPLIPKIAPPALSGVIPRKRLFNLLDTALKRPVVWLSAPGGSGKTTIVSNYLSLKKLPCLWYQVDEGDSDTASFFYYLGMAAKKAAPRKRDRLPLLTPEYLAVIPVFTRRYFEKLYGMLNPPCIIVLDNYQDVPEESGFHEVVNNALAVLPRGINVIIISRNETPGIYARLRANNGIAMLGWDDLRFTLDETLHLFAAAHKGMSEDNVKEIYRVTDGWAAGIVLMMEGSKNKDISLKPENTGSKEAVFDYFANEVFRKMDDQTQAFLLKTSFFPYVTPSMAEKLTANGRSRHILSYMRRNHFFTVRHTEEHSYRYHPLFREFLLSQANDTFQPGELKGIKCSAALILEEAGLAENAASLLCDAGDWPGVARLLRRRAPDLCAQGRSETVKAWLDALPQNTVEVDPEMLYWKAVCLVSVALPEALIYFEKAFDLYKRGGCAGAFLTWADAAETALLCEDYKIITHWITKLGEIQAADSSFPSRDIEVRVVLSRFNAMAFNEPHLPDVIRLKDRIFKMMYEENSLDITTFLSTGVYLAAYLLYQGEFDRALMVIEFLHGAAGGRKASDISKITIRSIYALYDFFAGDIESCLKKVDEGMRISEDSGVDVWYTHLHGHASAALLSAGNIAEAEKMLSNMAEHMNRYRKIDLFYYNFLTAWKSALQGDINRAFFYQESAFRMIHDVGFTQGAIYNYITMAYLLHKKGDVSKSLSYLSTARKMTGAIRSSYLEYVRLSFEAGMAFEKNDEVKCLAFLRKAMRIGRENGFANMFWWMPSMMSLLCAKALEADIEIQYVQDLIIKRRLDPPHEGIGNWPYPIEIYAAGRFEIVKAGKPLRFSGKVQKKPLELLRTIINLGGEGVSEERLADMIWPGAEGDAAHISFKTTLHRLRRLLGSEQAIKYRNGKVTIDRTYCRVDVLKSQPRNL